MNYSNGLFDDAGNSSDYTDQHLMVGFAGSGRRKQRKSSVWTVGVPAEIPTGYTSEALRLQPTCSVWRSIAIIVYHEMASPPPPPEIRLRPLPSTFFSIHYSPSAVSLLATLLNELYRRHGRKSHEWWNDVARGFPLCSYISVSPQFLLACIKQPKELVASEVIMWLSLPTYV